VQLEHGGPADTSGSLNLGDRWEVVADAAHQRGIVEREPLALEGPIVDPGGLREDLPLAAHDGLVAGGHERWNRDAELIPRSEELRLRVSEVMGVSWVGVGLADR